MESRWPMPSESLTSNMCQCLNLGGKIFRKQRSCNEQQMSDDHLVSVADAAFATTGRLSDMSWLAYVCRRANQTDYPTHPKHTNTHTHTQHTQFWQ